MNCNQAKEKFFDAMEPGSELASHIAGCAECAAALASLRSTMALLDEWKAPASSAYFNTRLQARLAEARREEEAASRSWMAKLWAPAVLRPALVAAMGLAFVVGMNYYQPAVNQNGGKMVVAAKGTAVGDLQALDNHQDLDSDDLLDDIGSNHPQQGSSQNQKSGSQL